MKLWLVLKFILASKLNMQETSLTLKNVCFPDKHLFEVERKTDLSQCVMNTERDSNLRPSVN